MMGVGLGVSWGFLIIPSCDFPYMRVDSHWPALTGLGLIIYLGMSCRLARSPGSRTKGSWWGLRCTSLHTRRLASRPNSRVNKLLAGHGAASGLGSGSGAGDGPQHSWSLFMSIVCLQISQSASTGGASLVTGLDSGLGAGLMAYSG